MNNRTQNATRNILWGVLNKFIVMGLPFVNRTVLVYILGASYLGLDSLFTSILQMLNIAELGFSSAIVFSMYKPIAEGNYVQVNALLNLYRKVYRIIGSIVLFIGIVIMPLLPKLIKSDLPNHLNLYSLYMIYLLNTVLGYWLFSYKKSLIFAYQREDVLSNINSIIVICKTFLQILMICFFRMYYLYALILPVTTLVENLIVEYWSKKIFPDCIPDGIVNRESRQEIKKRIYGLMIQKICSTSRNSLDSIVISAYVGLNNVSIYGNYYYIMAALHALLGTITSSITAVVGNSVAECSTEKNHSDMLKFNFIYMWIASNLTICLLCVFQPFMRIWMGNNMMFEIQVVIALCIYFYSLCIGDIRSVYVVASGLWYEGRYRAVLEAITNLVLNIYLGKHFGIMGIVVATIISILVVNFGYGSTIIYTYYFKNKKAHIYYAYHFYFAMITCIAGTASYKLCGCFALHGIWQIIVNVIICVIVTNCILVVAYCKLPVRKDARDMFLRILSKQQRIK